MAEEPSPLLDPTLQRLIKDAYTEVLEIILTANQELNNRITSHAFLLGAIPPTSTEPSENAEFFHALWNRLSVAPDPMLKDVVDTVLETNLVLDQIGLGPGEGIYEHHGEAISLCQNRR